MDFPPSLQFAVQSLQRQVAELQALVESHFARREGTVARYYQVRLARTVEDAESDPTYPVDATGADGYGNCTRPNTFPIVFLDGGFQHDAGANEALFAAHHDVPQAFAHNLTREYIPLGTELEVFQLRGPASVTAGGHVGEWWCDWRAAVRIGKTVQEIPKGDTGPVTRYDPATLEEADPEAEDDVLVLFSDVPAGAWIAYLQVGCRNLAIAAECDPDY